ncbi:MAG: beta-ketoacyl-[acyl-carrier-protein] synthase family protein [Planctomycetales bacterium]|nr:beta-ketoacyl-[acyl-carrier-protein] synthase family protein [Planctomycetales bacterium]
MTPNLKAFDPHQSADEPIVITGIGMLASVGNDRESVWSAVQEGRTGIRKVTPESGVPEWINIAAFVDMPADRPKRLKVITMAHRAAEEAIADASIDFGNVDPDRFACAVSGHMGDWRLLRQQTGFEPADEPGDTPIWNQFFPNSACWEIATRFGLNGPRICHSTACASGLIDIMCAARAIRDGRADIALAGSSEAIDPLCAAGFKKMRVLADSDDPMRSCQPFDVNRKGFVMGEGAAMFVIERLSHALERNATIYAEICRGRMLADAHHMTGLDVESESLTRLINETLRTSRLRATDLDYVNAHGTGTQQNDLMETHGIRNSLGSHADNICVSSLKSMLGHLVNASGSVELALTTLALRDGFVPPTLNLHDPDPACDLNYLPMVGRQDRIKTAMKLSLAFGGHLVAVALKRWDDVATGFAYPEEETRRAA